MNGKNIVKNIAIGFALALAGAGAVLFYKNNIAMNPGETLLKYMSYAEDGEYEEEIVEFKKRNKNIEYVIQPQISKFLILRYKAVSVLRVEKDSEIDLDTKDVFRYPIGTIHNQKVNLA